MKRKRMSIIAASVLSIAVSSAATGQPKIKRCTSPLASTGAAWLELQTGGRSNGVFYTQTNCPVNYSPVSGGVRYEGAWNDPSLAFKWKEIASLPYDELPNQEATAWRCMVLRTPAAGPNERPDALWCQAVCCRWD